MRSVAFSIFFNRPAVPIVLQIFSKRKRRRKIVYHASRPRTNDWAPLSCRNSRMLLNPRSEPLNLNNSYICIPPTFFMNVESSLGAWCYIDPLIPIDGKLYSSTPKFWLKDHLLSFVQGLVTNSLSRQFGPPSSHHPLYTYLSTLIFFCNNLRNKIDVWSYYEHDGGSNFMVLWPKIYTSTKKSDDLPQGWCVCVCGVHVSTQRANLPVPVRSSPIILPVPSL